MFLTACLLPIILNKESSIAFKFLVLSVDLNNILAVAYFIFIGTV